MAAYVPAGVVTEPPPPGTAQLVVLLVLVAVCVGLFCVLLVLLVRSCRPPDAAGPTTDVRLQPGADRTRSTTGHAAAAGTGPGGDIPGALDEDDVIAFGLALESCGDVIAHVERHGRTRPLVPGQHRPARAAARRSDRPGGGRDSRA